MKQAAAYFLAIDFGNTRKKCALFSRAGELYLRQFFHPATWESELQALLEKYAIYRIALSTVVPVPESVLRLLAHKAELIHIGQVPIPAQLRMPESFHGRMGEDRIALALGAISRQGGRNQVIISMGTCITYNFINAHNYFLGGSISPGLSMRFRALHEHTALLPLHSYQDIDLNRLPLVGYDSHTHIVGGVVQGIAKELEGMLASYAQNYAELSCIITGGDSQIFAELYANGLFQAPNIILNFDPDLLFNGLFDAYAN